MTQCIYVSRAWCSLRRMVITSFGANWSAPLRISSQSASNRFSSLPPDQRCYNHESYRARSASAGFICIEATVNESNAVHWTVSSRSFNRPSELSAQANTFAFLASIILIQEQVRTESNLAELTDFFTNPPSTHFEEDETTLRKRLFCLKMSIILRRFSTWSGSC